MLYTIVKKCTSFEYAQDVVDIQKIIKDETNKPDEAKKKKLLQIKGKI